MECTGSYGAALTRYLHSEGITVTEVNQPDKATRRRRGKTDAIDAAAAAQAVLYGRATATAKTSDGPVETVRKTAKASAIKSRSQGINQLKAVLVAADPALCEALTGLSNPKLIRKCSELESPDGTAPAAAARHTLRLLARRTQHLTEEINDLTARITAAITARAPKLLGGYGVGPDTAAALLAHAVVARWWEQALSWEREVIWPRRLHQVAGGNAGTDLESWRIVGQDAVVFPEVVAVADALLAPAMAEPAWRDSGAGQPRPLPVDGAFCGRLGERVERGWLGPLAATVGPFRCVKDLRMVSPAGFGTNLRPLERGQRISFEPPGPGGDRTADGPEDGKGLAVAIGGHQRVGERIEVGKRSCMAEERGLCPVLRGTVERCCDIHIGPVGACHETLHSSPGPDRLIVQHLGGEFRSRAGRIGGHARPEGVDELQYLQSRTGLVRSQVAHHAQVGIAVPAVAEQ